MMKRPFGEGEEVMPCGHEKKLSPPHLAGDPQDDVPCCLWCRLEQLEKVDQPASEAEEQRLIAQIDQLQERLAVVRAHMPGLAADMSQIASECFGLMGSKFILFVVAKSPG